MTMAEWTPRRVPADLASRYRDQGWWTDKTLRDVLVTALQRNGELGFRVWSDSRPWQGQVSDVAERAQAFAGALARRGIGPGDVIAFQLPNWAEAAVVFWGSILLGALIEPILHFYGPREVRFIVEQSGAKVLVAPERFGRRSFVPELEDLYHHVPGLEMCAVVGQQAGAGMVRFDDLFERSPPATAVALPEPEQPVLLAYTSGTTAEPKGVVHTHRTLLAEIRQMTMASSASRTTEGRRPAITAAPVGHSAGMFGGLLVPLLFGFPVHLMDVWNPERVLEAFDHANLSFQGGAPFFLSSLLDADSFSRRHPDHLRTVGLGGAPIPVELAERAGAMGINLTRMYGSTEHMTVTRTVPEDPDDKRVFTDGRPTPGVELRLTGEGEIQSRGPELFMGYTDPVITADAVDGEGWYSSGDLGTIDAEGYLTVTGRKKDIIIRGGENISPAEVEAVLTQMEGISEAVVVGGPDRRLGERVVAFVRLRPQGPQPTLDSVRSFLHDRGLGRQKWPEELHQVDDFDRTSTGKVKRHALLARLQADA